MASTDVPRVIRQVRQRMSLSQEGLARRLNATKAAVQHWERGRNQPDLARLILLGKICPPGTERRGVEGLIREVQDRVAAPAPSARRRSPSRRGKQEVADQTIERENARLRKQIASLQRVCERRAEQLRILGDLAADLQRQNSELKAARMQAHTAETPVPIP
jgi:transcriptional regulator with XRE-family HTH domain